ncbi:hypothetical protein EB796_010376 [Bugula neritina]|uniref:LicD/FKTN/FKRP nucleotidyltransferase domain-containing protein n=1 Tax=Bugula neritina TaxID=10212 RepID=A0A7J7JZC3_BUGNE|nr:hypothetical protein EB796_010376 [Bugula neritina]
MASSLRNTLAAFTGVSLLLWMQLYQSDLWQTQGEHELLVSAAKDQKLDSAKSLQSIGQSQPGRHLLSEEDKSKLKSFGVKKLRKIFKPFFNTQTKTQIMDSLKVLTDALDVAGVEYFMYGGSLIGSWRHHDIIPWDDDIDIIVNISDWRSIESINISGYTLNIRTLNRYKFYSNNATDIPGYFWKWPYIDVCFFGDNGTHLFDMDPNFSKTFLYDKADVFPLKRRPFGKLNLKTPKNTEKILNQNYDISECETRAYDHQRQKSLHKENITTIDCRLLHRIYPFAFRSSLDKAEESVYLDHRLIKTVNLNAIQS